VLLQVEEVLTEGYSNPLRITISREQVPDVEQVQGQTDSEKKKKRKRAQPLELWEFVLKRCGGTGPSATSAHIASEFCNLAIYDRAGAAVPRAALYSINVSTTGGISATACCTVPIPVVAQPGIQSAAG
jgi:hypothetical protein